MKIGFLGLLFFIPFLGYQNCSKLEIRPLTKIPEQVGSLPLQTSFCAPKGSSFTSPMRHLFLIDMSTSNYGKLHQSEPTVYQNGNYQITFTIETETATDLDGKRFDMVRDFIENCGGISSQYSIIGFSKGTHNLNNSTCISGFQSSTEALVSLDGLKQQQIDDLADPVRVRTNSSESPFNLKAATQYVDALNCMKGKVEWDSALLPPNVKPHYNIYFVTDGMTTDSLATQTLYKNIMRNTLAVVDDTPASGISFFPVFYKNQFTNPTEVSAAKNLLQGLADEIDPSIQVKDLSGFVAGNNAFCEMMTAPIQVDFSLQSMMAINLNTVRRDNQLLLDSDMDGVPDELELILGWDPYDSHSTGVLDSICLNHSSNKSDCVQVLSTLNCSPATSGLLLSDCDREFYKQIYGENLSMTDTDQDQIPDIVEILRKTNPLFKDAHFDPFGDGISNLQKIYNGYDVESSLKVYPVSVNDKTDISFDSLAGSCQDNTTIYNLTLNKIAMLETQGLQDSYVYHMDTSYDENENVILLFSYWRAMGNIEEPYRLYVNKIKIYYETNQYIMEPAVFLGGF